MLGTGRKIVNKSNHTDAAELHLCLKRYNSLQPGRKMKVSNDFSGALRTFAYFMASGSHYMLEDCNYLSLYGEEPGAIEIPYAIFANVLEMNDEGQVLNFTYAQRRATDYIKYYCDPSFIVSPPYEVWEQQLYSPPDMQDKI